MGVPEELSGRGNEWCLSPQALNKTSATPCNVVRLQTIFAQILFPHKVLSLSIAFILELETLLKFMCSIAELAYGSTIIWILPFHTFGVT